MFEKEVCHQSVWELTSVNMQLDSFKKRVLFTDQCSVSFGAMTLSFSCQSLHAGIIRPWICILKYKKVIVYVWLAAF